MSRLLLLFVIVPVVELVLLIEIGQRIGTLATLGLIVATGALGAYLTRRQGLGVLRRMREEMAAGRIPAAPIMDGIIILIAGAVLMTPGVLTDAFGFFCLIPALPGAAQAVRQGAVRAGGPAGRGDGLRGAREMDGPASRLGRPRRYTEEEPPAEDGERLGISWQNRERN